MFKEDRIELIKIGLECKEIREKAKLTMKQVSQLFDIVEYTIANFEYGRVNNAVIYNKYLKLRDGKIEF